MKNYELIGLICAATVENNINITTAEIIKIAEYFGQHDTGTIIRNRITVENLSKFDSKDDVVDIDVDVDVEIETEEEKPVVDNPVEELGISKKNQEKLRHATLDDIVKPKAQTELDKRMEDAYLGEHPNIQPAPVEKKPLSPREQQLWDYMQAHPDARMPSICEALGISNANYYMLKVQLKKKGWIVSAVENVKAIELE